MTDEETDKYAHLKEALLQQLCPDTDEERLIAHDELSCRKLKGQESIDELAWDNNWRTSRESFAWPSWCGEKTKLCFHLINALQENVLSQLKLLPKGNYRETIAKAKEFWLMYSCKDKMEQANRLGTIPGCGCLDKMEEALQQVTEQMAVMGR